MAKKQIPPFGLRMPKELHEWVKEKATQQGRSMNNFVVHLLETQREDENALP